MYCIAIAVMFCVFSESLKTLVPENSDCSQRAPTFSNILSQSLYDVLVQHVFMED